jgi:hypothetical protein
VLYFVNEDRQHIRIWFDVLAELDQTQQEMAIRNEYIWFILLMLQNNRIEEYFKELPPRKILPLRDVLVRCLSKNRSIRKTIFCVILGTENNR